MAPNFYIAFSVPNQRAASDLVTPVPSHTGFFVQLIALIDYTCSTDVFKCGVTVVQIKLCHATVTSNICMK